MLGLGVSEGHSAPRFTDEADTECVVIHNALCAEERSETEALFFPSLSPKLMGGKWLRAACLEQLITWSWLHFREQHQHWPATLKPPGTFAETVGLEELRE